MGATDQSWVLGGVDLRRVEEVSDSRSHHTGGKETDGEMGQGTGSD